MPKHRFKKAFSTSFLVHASLLVALILFLNQKDLVPKLASFERFDVSALSSSKAKSSQNPSTLKPTQAVSDPQSTSETSAGNPEKGTLLAQNDYYSALRQKVKAQERYPTEAIKRKLEGVVEIEFEVGEQGEITKIMPISAGKPVILVEAARDAVERAAPFSPPPAGILRKFVIPIEFKIK